MAAAFLDRALERAGVPALVRSAGTNAREGSPALLQVVETMQGYEIDLTEHRGTPLTPALVQGAHVVLGLTREHLREAVMMDQRMLESGFTVRELARRSGLQGFRPAGAELRPWLAELVAERDVGELLGTSALDDVDDPTGGPLAAYQDTAAELSALVDRIVGTIWPGTPRS
jgi:protein-tyrosine-phosphatase